MEEVKELKNPLETEPIGRLILKYSVPTALTLMVNYLYNIAVSYTHLDVYKRQDIISECEKLGDYVVNVVEARTDIKEKKI